MIMPSDLLCYATTRASDGELKRIGDIVGVRRAHNETSRAFSFRISVALQDQNCAREREIADREELLSLGLSLGKSPHLNATEQRR
jgi:hypothetical protein